MKKSLALIISLSLTLLLAGCGSQPKVQYTDPNTIDVTNIYFGSTDLQTTANKMVSDMLTFPAIVQLTQKTRPIIFIDSIQNETDEHVNTNNINNMVSTKLLQSGKFRFVDMSKVSAVKDQLRYQKNSGLVDPKSAIQAGHQIGAQFMLYGSISDIDKSNKHERSRYYLITMKLLNLKTGIVEWMGQKQIRKVES